MLTHGTHWTYIAQALDVAFKRTGSFRFLFFFFVFCLFRAAPVSHGGSQARGLIRAVAASLRHSHSNARSKPRLGPTPELMARPDP